MVHRSGLRRTYSKVTGAISGRGRGNLHREGSILVTLRNGVGDITCSTGIVVIVPEVDDRVKTATHVGAAPRCRQRDAIVASGATCEISSVDGVQQYYLGFNGFGTYLERVTGHVIGGSLVSPVGTELRQRYEVIVGRQHHGSELDKVGLAVQSHGHRLSIGAGDGYSTGVGTKCRRSVGHIDIGIVSGTRDNLGLVDGEAFTLNSQRDVTLKVSGIQDK